MDAASRPRMRILRRLGSGMFGYVYLVKIGTRYRAIKRVVKVSCVESREQTMMTRLKHPGIIEYSSIALTQSCVRIPSRLSRAGTRMPLFLNFEMNPYDTSLSTLVRMNGNGLPLELVKDISYQILSALKYVHMKAIAHRDVKPDNILVMLRTRRSVLADWGSSTSAAAQPRSAPAYAPPEQLLGVDTGSTAADVWGLGASIYEALTGKRLIPEEFAQDPVAIILHLARRCGGLTPSVFNGAIGELGGAYEAFVQLLENSEDLVHVIPLRTELAQFGSFGVLICNMLRLSHKARLHADEAMLDSCFDDVRCRWDDKII